MKRIGWLVLMMALSLPALAGCSQSEPGILNAFDTLARWVPSDTEQVFFLNLKPDGETGRHWERIRRQLEANPTGQQALDGLYHQFRVEGYGLDEFTLGSAVNWYGDRTKYVIVQVSDEKAAEDALRQHFEDVAWEQEEYEGWTLYHRGPSPDPLAWAIYDGLLFLSYNYDQESLTQLKALASLAQADSLVTLPAWRTLRDRLPENLMGLMFFNVAEQTRHYPPPANDTSLGTALGQQITAIALAAVPEQERIRIEMTGTVVLQSNALPETRALFNRPTVDPTAWTSLPADTAIALITHDASVVWPALKEAFGLNSPVQLRDTIGLDLEADLAGAEGPLTGDFALAITPPLPNQPISQGLPAGQLLILARGVSEAQMADVQAAMESRGAIFGPGEVESVALQTQAGTEPSGYAIAYGFDGDILLFGSSPDVIGQGIAAWRESKGPVTTATFRAMLATLPDDPSFVVYVNTEALTNLLQANTTEEQYQRHEEYLLLEAFEAIGLGLQFQPDRLDGVIYFFVRE